MKINQLEPINFSGKNALVGRKKSKIKNAKESIVWVF
jgi:hypothetical protein